MTYSNKEIARQIANTTSLDYHTARAWISEARSEGHVRPVEYHTGMRAWMYTKADRDSLVEVANDLFG